MHDDGATVIRSTTTEHHSLLQWPGTTAIKKTLIAADPQITIELTKQWKDDATHCKLIITNASDANITLENLEVKVESKPPVEDLQIGLIDFSSSIVISDDTIFNKHVPYEKVFTYDHFVEVLDHITGLGSRKISNKITHEIFSEIEEYLNGFSDFRGYSEYQPALYIRPFILLSEQTYPAQVLETIFLDPVAYQSSDIEQDTSRTDFTGSHYISWEFHPFWKPVKDSFLENFACSFQWETPYFQQKADRPIMSVNLSTLLLPAAKSSYSFDIPMLEAFEHSIQLSLGVSTA
jgi:hypothetical protein